MRSSWGKIVNKLKQAFFRLTGGRPMKMITKCHFIDVVSGDEVGIYECRLTGTQYLAVASCDMFRVEIKRTDIDE